MPKDYRGQKRDRNKGLLFCNEIDSPVGYLRSGAIKRRPRITREPETGELWSVSHYILVMLLEGSTAYYVNEQGFECPLQYGDFLFVFPGFKQLYGPGMGDHWAEVNVGFVGAIFDALREVELISTMQPVWRLSDPAPWIEGLHGFIESPRPSTPHSVAAEAARFAAFIMELLQAAKPCIPDERVASSDWFTQARVMLTNDLSSKINLPEIASELGMNYSTFRLYFSQRAGTSPMKFRDRHRLHMACELLGNSNKLVTEIALSLGFYDDRHFATWLKRQIGVSPRVYRQSRLSSGSNSA
jgi:AraC-like DNA-binding protein